MTSINGRQLPRPLPGMDRAALEAVAGPTKKLGGSPDETQSSCDEPLVVRSAIRPASSEPGTASQPRQYQ